MDTPTALAHEIVLEDGKEDKAPSTRKAVACDLEWVEWNAAAPDHGSLILQESHAVVYCIRHNGAIQRHDVRALATAMAAAFRHDAALAFHKQLDETRPRTRSMHLS
ncbi:hypothetical protein AeRB84_003427 [Aphanomyces euteiches]|nr:hypothetical protein AeRB84_003427 [Aphanomyces euteiches]